MSDLPIPGAPHIIIGLCNLMQCSSASFASLGVTVLFCDPTACLSVCFALAILSIAPRLIVIIL